MTIWSLATPLTMLPHTSQPDRRPENMQVDVSPPTRTRPQTTFEEKSASRPETQSLRVPIRQSGAFNAIVGRLRSDPPNGTVKNALRYKVVSVLVLVRFAIWRNVAPGGAMLIFLNLAVAATGSFVR